MARPKKRRVELAAQRKRKRNAKRPIPLERALTHEEIVAAAEFPIAGGKKLRIPTSTRRKVRKKQITTTVKLREITIISRVGQPQITTTIEPLERKSYPPTSVSSSWLATIGYFFNDKIGTFTTKTGRQYKIINFDFDTFEEWYYAHSKGTFFNQKIRNKYTIKGTL